MPRILWSTVHKTYRHSYLAALLLRECRDANSAINELRWIREHVRKLAHTYPSAHRARLCRRLCKLRAKGVPLQYILGDTPFGDLTIKCQPGVLIPRPETEVLTEYLASRLLLSRMPSTSLRIFDLCTGSGCISILLHRLLCSRFVNLKIVGIDKSPTALSCAQDNLQLYDSPLKEQITFQQGDVLTGEVEDFAILAAQEKWDIVVANPPYISARDHLRTTTRSVRRYEPWLALVGPGTLGDDFYPRIEMWAARVSADICLVEVAGLEQACRIARLFLSEDGGQEQDRRWAKVEIWRDRPLADTTEEVCVGGKIIEIRGLGNGRAVCAWTRKGAGLLGMPVDQES